MSTKLSEFGMHGRDAVELLRNVDRAYLREHPEEDDPEEFFTISKKTFANAAHQYTMMSDRREGFVIQHADTMNEVVTQLVERGFAKDAVEGRLAEVEALWERDVTTGRMKPGSIDVERRENGYVWRGFGDAWALGGPWSAAQIRKMLYFHDQSELDRAIARADEEWGAQEPPRARAP